VTWAFEIWEIKMKSARTKGCKFIVEKLAILKILEFCSFISNFLTFKIHQAILK
jgi:hypothetical protein